MSVMNFYLNKGYTPVVKTYTINGAGTVVVWTPVTGSKIVLTQLVLASNLAGSTTFYFGATTGDPLRVVQFNHAGSATVNMELLADANIYDRTLVANSKAPGTDGICITATGFEIPST